MEATTDENPPPLTSTVRTSIRNSRDQGLSTKPQGRKSRALGDEEEEEGIVNDENEPLDTFCQDHIRIPPQLPNILKQFTKAAIRTQPRDLDRWGAAYFRAMADGQVPPVKETLEYPVIESKDGLTVGLLRVLDRQVSKNYSGFTF